MSERILRLPALTAKTGLPRSSIYMKIAQGTFPKSTPLGPGRAVGWFESQIDGWLESLTAE